MARIGSFVLFLCIAFGILGGVHLYFWVRLVRDTALPAPARQIATYALVALALSLPAALVLTHREPRGVPLLAWPAYVWMGLMLLLFTLLVGAEWVWLAARATGHAVDPERRLLLRRLCGGAAALGAALLGARALAGGLRRPGVRELSVRLGRLPAALDGLSIVQLTDIHLGPTLGREFMEQVVERANALSPDLVAITGDLADGTVAALGDAAAPLARLRAPLGVYFITGNHEYYSGVLEWLPFIESLGIRVLRNERVSIGRGGDSFDLAGVDDYSAHGFAPGHGPDLARALAGRDATRELVLLAHQPRQIHEAARHGVGLQLSGHTHGGQLWPFGYLVRLQQPYVAGLHRQGATQIYISRGTGHWGPPMRLAAPAEITKIVLRAGSLS